MTNALGGHEGENDNGGRAHHVGSDLNGHQHMEGHQLANMSMLSLYCVYEARRVVTISVAVLLPLHIRLFVTQL